MLRSLVISTLFFAALFGFVGCTSSGNCGEGGLCECAGGDQCYLDCAGDHCNQSCHDMRQCGTVCGNDCSSDCHSVGTECSQSCGDDCVLTCESMPTCGVICGANCNYKCTSITECAARVGPGSDVTCSNFQSCTVECTGTCTVHTDNPAQVTCSDGSAATMCSPGLFKCGGC